ncbi:MAG: hypothetical protein NTW19_13410 [Planctomycetota bacterium]|nr:hypothetical protein [Planctomycetota bacterium]
MKGRTMRNRTALIAGLVVASMGLGAAASIDPAAVTRPAEPEGAKGGPATPVEERRKVEKQLAAPVPLVAEGRSLSLLLDYFRNVSGANILVDWKALAALGLKPESVVTMKFPQTTAAEALPLAMRLAIGDDKKPRPRFEIFRNAWMISTPASLARWQRELDLPAKPIDADRQALAKLAEELPICFEQNKLSNVLDFYRNITGLTIKADWDVLKGAGLEEESPVSAFWKSAPGGTSLLWVLHAAADPDAKASPKVEVRNGEIHISAR